MIFVVERSHDDQPFTGGNVSGKGAVGVRTDVEPFVLSLVVEEEVVGNTVACGVVQRSRDEVGVLQGHFVGLINGIEADSKGVKELLPNQIVLCGVFVGRCGPVEHQVVATRSEGDRYDTGLGVVFAREVQRVLAFIDRFKAERWCSHRSVLKRAVFCRVEEDVHDHINGVRFRGEFHG